MLQIPTPADTLRKRQTFTGAVRLAAILMALVGLAAFCSWFLEGYMDGDLFDIIYYSDRVIATAGGLLGGVLFFAFASPIARLLVPWPASGCPRCRYPAEGTGANCPECGLSLEPSDLGLMQSPPTAWTPAARAWLVATMTSWIRLLGMTLGAYWLAGMLYRIVAYGAMDEMPFGDTYTTFVTLVPAVKIALAALAFVLAPLIARIVVPRSPGEPVPQGTDDPAVPLAS